MSILPLNVKWNKCSQCGCRLVDHDDGVCQIKGCSCERPYIPRRSPGMDLSDLYDMEAGT
jgi:hypothetical protein